MVTATATRNAISGPTVRSGWYEIRRLDALVAQNEGGPREDAVADGIESGRLARQELPELVELEAVDRIPSLRLDERQRDHPVEEEVIGVAAGAREVRRAEPLGEGQASKDPEVFLGRAG